MTRFVATLANGGNLAKGNPVASILNIEDREILRQSSIGSQVLTSEAAALTRELMKLVIRYGTGGSSRGAAGKKGYRGLAIGKTGTTDKNKDLWFVGSTPTYSGALWLGYDLPMNLKSSSSELAAPLWGWWMKAIHEGLPIEKEFRGLQLESQNVCSTTGKRSNGSCRILPVPILGGQKSKGFCKIQHPVREKSKFQSLWRKKEMRRKEIEEKRRLEKEKKEQEQQKAIEKWRDEKPEGKKPIPFEKPEQKE
jgi:membrane peptidoglycan carboxypeptidase